MQLSPKLLSELQRRLKVGNRRGVHLNAIPSSSKYKFDLHRLTGIQENLPDSFLKMLLNESSFKFKVSWDEMSHDLNFLTDDAQIKLVKINKSLEDLANQIDAIEAEKGINSFGFGYPLLIRRDLSDKKIVVAPIFIWSLKIKRSRELNTWEISRSEEDLISINEVLINHLLIDTQVAIDPIGPDSLEKGFMNCSELVDYCFAISKAINTSVKEDLKDIFNEKAKLLIPIKEKKFYESLPLLPYTSFIDFCGLFSIFEVQKQNIIEDYDALLKLQSVSFGRELEGQSFQSISSVETDPSQQGILNLLATKRSVLIQGPPGTGKSQSLTAIIVNALENKKKVIVVCEKFTALEVLKNSLGYFNLDRNTILIKDIVKDRRAVVESVRDRLDDQGFRSLPQPKDSISKIITQINNHISFINGNHQKLAVPIIGESNWSHVVGELMKVLRNATESLVDLSEIPFLFSHEEFDEYILDLDKGSILYNRYIPNKGYSFINPEKLVGENRFDIEEKYQKSFKSYNNAYLEIQTNVVDYLSSFRNLRTVMFDKELQELTALIKFKDSIDTVCKSEFEFKIAYQKFSYHKLSEQLEDIKALINEIDSEIESLSISPDFLNEKKTSSLFYKVSSLFSSKGKLIAAQREQVYQRFLNLQALVEEVDGLSMLLVSPSINYNISLKDDLIRLISDRVSNKAEYFESFYKDINLLDDSWLSYLEKDFNVFKKQLKEVQTIIPELTDHRNLLAECDCLIKAKINSFKEFKVLAHNFQNRNFDDLKEVFAVGIRSELQKLNPFSIDQNIFGLPQVIQINQLLFELNSKMVSDQWYTKKINLKSYEDFSNQFNLFREQNSAYFTNSVDLFSIEFDWFNFYYKLLPDRRKLITLLMHSTNWKSAFSAHYLDAILRRSATEDLPINDLKHNDLRQSLTEFDKRQINFVNSLWSFKQSTITKQFEATNKDVTVENLYNKRTGLKFKRLTLRQIVSKDMNLFTTFFPVILTTPEVCSNLFKGTNNYFDLVIFDEASQLRLEDNLPAILKAKQIIIAGDEHQMPPSDFFSKVFDGVVEDEEEIDEEEEAPILDKDELLLSCKSLLEFATEMSFEKRFLDFHYRSQHPYLIDFSNAAFYKQRLIPLPNKVEYNPIKYIQVGGTFSDHTNEREADAVLKVLEFDIHRLEGGKYPSVGIATLNLAQRDLIKNKLIHRQQQGLTDLFGTKIQELEECGLFVKNLENIQGDERDIIILSTTYGINQDGKFNQRFGPINQSKGYKLLNVIVTRAKFKVFLCTSVPEIVFMNYKEYLLTQPNNGKSFFFAYLAYAKAVSEENYDARLQVLQVLAGDSNNKNSLNNTNQDLESPFEEEVYRDMLTHFAPHKIIPQFKFAGFRIDMVYDTGIPGKPLIAIECDGAKYHDSHEAYLHDLYRQKILEGNNFVFHRIWSTNWWRNPKRELNQLVSFINAVEAA